MPYDTSNVREIAPWASENPAWSGPSPKEIGPTYGTLWAEPGAIPGSFVFWHDLERRHHALTSYNRPLTDEIRMCDRRWRVRRMEPVPQDAA